ncbi:MAG: TetR/AcrR family transcriptional regulator [Lachnospiraceae bacterium]|nr:TetR/AcrR family transcriptional regulator [Lachnospiraceae bacterium]
MPKVSEEYIQNKKKSIVDATYRVCLRKPVEMVTMTDVIEETGLSQGGIYRFYKDLDEVLCDMIANMRSDYNITCRIDEATNDKDAGFEEITHRVCSILAEVMEEHLLDIQKINFDLNVLAINEPKRAAKIIGAVKGGNGNLEYLAKVTLPLIEKACKERQLTPKRPPKEILEFISAAYTGIEMNCILTACYKGAATNVNSTPGPLFDTLATSIILLFGGEEP